MKTIPCLLSAKAALQCVALALAATPALADEPRRSEPILSTEAGDFSVSLEPGVAIPLTSPQSDLFSVGGSQAVKARWALNRYLDLGPAISFVGLPSRSPQVYEAGSSWTIGPTLRLKRPHDMQDDDSVRGLSPWVDVDAFYARTGPLNRPGFAAAVGLSIPVGKRRTFWIGPFARYMQIIQINRDDFDNHDAKILNIGVSLEVGSGIERRAHELIAAEETKPVHAEPAPCADKCPDRDMDTVPDGVDRCPDVAGPMDFFGCPPYKKITVKPDKLELKEKLYFAYNQATLQPVSFPVLDEVVQALKDNKNFRVQVEGHTSSEGGDDHNQTLSEQRASAVLEYLTSHGIGKERLVSKGFASSVPVDTNTTVAGRENNRRVEFVVNFIILNKEYP